MKSILMNIKSKIRYNLTVFKEVIEFNKSKHYIRFTMRSFEGIFVYTSNGFIAQSGVPSYIPQAITINNEGTHVIIVNDGFNDLDMDYQEAILSHEIGHIVNGDLDELKSFINMIKYRVSRSFGTNYSLIKEIAADRYAFDKGYDIINALSTIRNLYDGIGRKELDKRIDILNNL